MSDDEPVDTSRCASCGISEIDDIKLKECDGCDLVRYCSDDCQENHKSEHEEECIKRAAELRDELLFKQPENTHKGDCPICMIPIPLHPRKSVIYLCCGKIICSGCCYANVQRENEMRMIQRTCPFCRNVSKSKKESHKLLMKRVEANDPVAIRFLGEEHNGKKHYSRAFECFTKAAELGDMEAHYRLSKLYHYGRFVEKDEGKMLHHMEEAAIGGHAPARNNLGGHEWKNGEKERAVKHWVIAAALGFDASVKTLMEKFIEGGVKKEDLAAALRANEAAVDATKSPQRQAEEDYLRKKELLLGPKK